MARSLHRFRCLVSLFVLLFFASGAALLGAQSKFAFVIGNANYKGMTPLKNSGNDARDIASALRELGFSVDVLVDADLSSMENGLVKFSQQLSGSPGSIGFFFYAGHGVQSSDGNNYLIPADASIPAEAFLKSKAMALQTVLDVLQDSKNGLNMIVLDACRDNPFAWSRSASRGLAVVRGQPSGSIIAYATSAGSVAQDGTERNGLYTSVLLKNLRTPGLEIKDVFNLTGKGVRDASGGAQIPAVYNQFFDSAFLAGQPTPAPSAAPVVQIAAGKSGPALPQRPAGTLVSSDFEGGTDGWGSKDSSPEKEIVTSSGDLFHSGNSALKISGRKHSWNGFQRTVLEKPKPGSWYSFSAWILVPKGAPFTPISATLQLFPVKGSTQGLEYRTVAVRGVARGEWSRIKGIFQIPQDRRFDQVDFSFETIFKEDRYMTADDKVDFVFDEFTLSSLTVDSKPVTINFPSGEMTFFTDQKLHEVSALAGSGDIRDLRLSWSSADESILMVTPRGQAMGLRKGRTMIVAETDAGYIATSWVNVVDVSGMKSLKEFTFDSTMDINRFLYQKTIDWDQNPPRESKGSGKAVYVADAGDGGKGDGAIRYDFQNEDLGYLANSLDFAKLPGQLPAGSIISFKVKTDLEGVDSSMGIVLGAPDWKWFGDGNPVTRLIPGQYANQVWMIPSSPKLKTDAILKLQFGTNRNFNLPAIKGSIWVDDFQILVPADK